MGASLSSLTDPTNLTSPGLGDIPESCVACVFLNLTPPEICNLARLNRAFRGAASSDSVWETKLPENYHRILDLVAPPEQWQGLSKKDVFALLSRRIQFDGSTKEVWLDRVTGKICMSISAKGMAITGIEDRRYWNWVPTEESRFHVVAYLQQIWWFEVDGAVAFPFPANKYTLFFRVHLGRFTKRLGRRVSTYEHTHGLEIKPVRFEFSTSDGQQAYTEYLLDEAVYDDTYGNNKKRGSWLEYRVGEFVVAASDPPTEIKFSMKQIDCTHSKGGLCLDYVSIIPTELVNRRRKGFVN